MINEVWVRDNGQWRKIEKFYEHKEGEGWIEIDAQRAVELQLKYRTKHAALWWWVAAVAFMVAGGRLLLT